MKEFNLRFGKHWEKNCRNKQTSQTNCNPKQSSNMSDSEGRNILCIFKLVYGVGLRALRKLFENINPWWSNKPSDAASFDKGKTMRLGREDEATFNQGNIENWDFSLMTTVLLFTPPCRKEIKRRPGYSDALKELKDCRNKLLGHPSTDRMSDADFNYFWPRLSRNFIKVGADKKEVDELQFKTDEVLVAAEYYKERFIEEQNKERLIERKLDAILANQAAREVRPEPSFVDDSCGLQREEWEKFRKVIGEFDTQKYQYILITDSVTRENLECYSILRGVAWKMVLDFDPLSEEKGFYLEFTSAQERQCKLVTMFTPAELNSLATRNLLRQIDSNRIQWVFVNGRSGDSDGSSKEFPAWEACSVRGISRFLGICSDPEMFDQLKPVICLILPFSDKSIPYLQVTLSRLTENFNNLNLKLVSVDTKNWPRDMSEKLNVRCFHDLSHKILNLGFRELLDTSRDQKIRMPTPQTGVKVELKPREFAYLTEHLEIMYAGCEDLPADTGNASESEEHRNRFLEEQRKSFLSGNQISFASLFDNHDARRQMQTEVQIHVQRLLESSAKGSVNVEIRHSPGTGGTTIARRVLWDLHNEYPCALINVASHRYSDEETTYVNELAERIASLEEICLNATPLILIDGRHRGGPFIQARPETSQ